MLIGEQHAYIRNRSTVSNLLVYEQFLLDAVENRQRVDAGYTDFAKAFDKVSYSRRKVKIIEHFRSITNVARNLLVSEVSGSKNKKYYLYIFSRYIWCT